MQAFRFYMKLIIVLEDFVYCGYLQKLSEIICRKYSCFNLLILIYSVKLSVMTHITMEDNNANLPSSVRHDNHLHTIIKGKSPLFIHHRIIIQQIIVYLTRHRLSNYLLHYHCQIHSHHTIICNHLNYFQHQWNGILPYCKSYHTYGHQYNLIRILHLLE